MFDNESRADYLYLMYDETDIAYIYNNHCMAILAYDSKCPLKIFIHGKGAIYGIYGTFSLPFSGTDKFSDKDNEQLRYFVDDISPEGESDICDEILRISKWLVRKHEAAMLHCYHMDITPCYHEFHSEFAHKVKDYICEDQVFSVSYGGYKFNFMVSDEFVKKVHRVGPFKKDVLIYVFIKYLNNMNKVEIVNIKSARQ